MMSVSWSAPFWDVPVRKVADLLKALDASLSTRSVGYLTYFAV